MSSQHFSSYELVVIGDIAYHIAEPSLLQTALEKAGYPAEKAMEWLSSKDGRLPVAITNAIVSGSTAAMTKTVELAAAFHDRGDVFEHCRRLGSPVSTWEEVHALPLELQDIVADRHNLNQAILIGLEGALAAAAATLAEGAGPWAYALLPSIIAADITASMTMLAGNVSRIAASYGFDPAQRENFPHILAALAPTSLKTPDGFLPAKSSIFVEVRAAQKFLKTLGQEEVKQATPRLIAMLTSVASRLQIVLTEKELAVLVPLVGIALNGSANVAYQQVSTTYARDYFRRQVLNARHGEDAVTAELNRALAEIKSRVSGSAK